MNMGTQNIQNLKHKLSNICVATKFCGICLESGEQLWSMDTEFDIIVDQQAHKKPLKDVIDYILRDAGHQILASSYVCSQCTEKSIQSYIFIYNTKQLSQIVYKCVTELYSKTVDIQNQLSEISLEFENSNIVIVLEQDSQMCQYTKTGKTTAIIAKETSKSNENTIKIPKLGDVHESEQMLSIIEAVNDEKVIVEPIQKFFIEITSNSDTREPSSVVEALTTECSKLQEEKIEQNNLKLLGISDIKFSDDTEVLEENYDDKIKIMYVDEAFDFSEQVDANLVEDKENENTEILLHEKSKQNTNIPPTHKCKRCREVLPSYKGWKKHVKLCRTIKIEASKFSFKCKICNETFTSQRTLNAHYKTHSKVKCKVCQFIVPTEDLTEHMKINHEDYTHTCKLCKFFTFNAAGLKIHMEKNHSGSKCALCHKKVSEIDLKMHKCRFNCLECLENICMHYKYLVSFRDQVLRNISKIKCIDCDYVCPRREALLAHANREHLDHHPFTCAHCYQQFYSRTALRHHINQFHKERHVCEFCDQEFTTLFTLNNHKEECQSIERHHKCEHCKSSFATLDELANHVKLRHDKECFDCNLCKRQFLSNTKLQEHVFRIHSGLQMKRKRCVLECPICDIKFATKKNLLEHMSIHEPGSRFPCKDCREDFDSLKKLQAHKRIHYNDVIQCVECKKVLTSTFFPHHMVYCKPGREEKIEIYTCETCGKTYNSELQLKLHHKTHMDKTPCPICQKPTKPVYMKSHIKYMHSKPKKIKKVKPKIKTKYIIKCDLCLHTVSRYGELETHMNRFHLKVKPYQCNYCNKSFFGKERLRGHLVTHTTSKVCFCSVCNKKFENKACLKLHMRRHTGDTPYACDVCGERFRTSSIMNTHKVKRHSVKSVSCPLCESMFYLRREMRSHFKKVHWKQKDKKFDPREVKELSPAFYYLFEDGRLPKVDGEDLCISSKFNEKCIVNNTS